MTVNILKFHKCAVCTFTVIGCMVYILNCSMPIGIKEQARARILLEDSRKQYASEDWTRRRKAVEQLTVYLSQLDKSIVNMITSDKQGDSEPIETFYLSAAKDKHSFIRIEALKGLAVILGKNAYSYIAEMALYDRSDNVRWYAVQALSLYRNSAAADIFVHSLQDDDWLIREAAIRGILMLDEEFQVKNMVPFIIKAINDSNNNVKAAALSCVKIKDTSLYNEIAQLLRGREKLDSRLIIAILKALQGYVLTNDIRKIVIDLLSYNNREVRVLALRVLKKEKIVLGNKKRM